MSDPFGGWSPAESWERREVRIAKQFYLPPSPDESSTTGRELWAWVDEIRWQVWRVNTGKMKPEQMSPLCQHVSREYRFISLGSQDRAAIGRILWAKMYLHREEVDSARRGTRPVRRLVVIQQRERTTCDGRAEGCGCAEGGCVLGFDVERRDTGVRPKAHRKTVDTTRDDGQTGGGDSRGTGYSVKPWYTVHIPDATAARLLREQEEAVAREKLLQSGSGAKPKREQAKERKPQDRSDVSQPGLREVEGGLYREDTGRRTRPEGRGSRVSNRPKPGSNDDIPSLFREWER